MPFKADAARRHHIPADSPTADRLDERCSPCVIWSSSYSSRAPVFMLWSPRRVSNRTVVSAGDHGNAGSTLNRDRADDSFADAQLPPSRAILADVTATTALLLAGRSSPLLRDPPGVLSRATSRC
jgi:hypothetical protein